MAKISATFLGTGTSQGIPVIACKCRVCLSANPKDNRTRTSLLLTINGKNCVIDTGPDFRQQMLREKINHLDAVLFTHEHKDHISGMDDIRAYNYVAKSPMKIFADKRVEAALHREFHYVFSGDDYPGIPKVDLTNFETSPFEILGETIIPIEVMHYKLPVKAFRLHNFTYITDANFIDNNNFEKIKGTEILVLNALRKEKHISHFNLEEALALIEKIKPKKAYLTHISHLFGLHEVESKMLPSNVEIAYDGLSFEIL